MTIIENPLGQRNVRTRFDNYAISSIEDEDYNTFLNLDRIETNAVLIRGLAPYMDNTLALDLAAQGLDPIELSRSSSAINGMITTDQLVQGFKSLSTNEQRGEFERLTFDQQNAMLAVGYEVPDVEEPNFFIRGLGAIGSKVGDTGVGSAIKFVGCT